MERQPRRETEVGPYLNTFKAAKAVSLSLFENPTNAYLVKVHTRRGILVLLVLYTNLRFYEAPRYCPSQCDMCWRSRDTRNLRKDQNHWIAQDL
jgi:hypothetical protein